MAGNEQGLAFVGGFHVPSARNQSPILLLKLKVSTKSQIEKRQDGTEAQ